MTHIENVHRGDYITVLDVLDFEHSADAFGNIALSDRSMVMRQEIGRHGFLKGEVMHVAAINPPFIAVTVYPSGPHPPTRSMVDTRLVDFRHITKAYADFFVQDALNHVIGELAEKGYVVTKRQPEFSPAMKDAMKRVEDVLAETIGPDSFRINFGIGGPTGAAPTKQPLKPDEPTAPDSEDPDADL